MTDPTTMGAYLRAARLARRVSIERAAEETRIRPDFLKRMESDEFDFLAPAYVRGFLRSYARYLQTDSQPLMDEFERRYGGGRVDTAQIAALERHGKKQALPRKRLGSWAAAALLAGGALLLLAIVGILTTPDERGPEPPAAADGSPSPSSGAEPSVSPSVRPPASPRPPGGGKITFEDGIDLVIVASRGDCWIRVTRDGLLLTGGRTLAVGERFAVEAEQRIEMRLGYPAGVELVVNGRNTGAPPGGQEPVDLVLPDDIDILL